MKTKLTAKAEKLMARFDQELYTILKNELLVRIKRSEVKSVTKIAA